jgi:hypothetical protein
MGRHFAVPRPVLTPSRVESVSTGNERGRTGSRRIQPAGRTVFPQLETRVRFPHINVPRRRLARVVSKARVDQFAPEQQLPAMPDTPPGVTCIAEVAKAATAYRRA